jgi:GNAT superfamily N-acetyltransferase
VGTFALLIMRNLAHCGAPSGIVEDVVVDEGARGRGVGRRMMEYARARCREEGCYKLVLSSNVSRTDAHRFYESLGFRRHGYSFAVDL